MRCTDFSRRLISAALDRWSSHNRFNQVRRLLISLVIVLPGVFLAARSAQGRTAEPPDYVVYRRIFHHVALLKQMADAAQQKGMDRSNLRQLVRSRAGITGPEGESLERISLQCESDVAAEDAKAKVIIDRFHTQYPSRIINPSFLPKTPPELVTLWQERSNIILGARDRLRGELGEKDFAKFDQFVREQSATPSFSPAASRQKIVP